MATRKDDLSSAIAQDVHYWMVGNRMTLTSAAKKLEMNYYTFHGKMSGRRRWGGEEIAHLRAHGVPIVRALDFL